MDWIDITYGSEFCYIPREISTMLPVALSEDLRTYVCEQDRYYYTSIRGVSVYAAVGRTLRNHSFVYVSRSIYNNLQPRRARDINFCVRFARANCHFANGTHGATEIAAKSVGDRWKRNGMRGNLRASKDLEEFTRVTRGSRRSRDEQENVANI